MISSSSKFLLRTILLSVASLIGADIIGEPGSFARDGQRQIFDGWLLELRQEAMAEGIAAKTADAALRGIMRIPRVIELDRNQPEFKQTLAEYLCRIVSPQKITKGRKMLLENRSLLNDISERYGVRPRFLVALWGIESDFGRITGDFPTIAALVTLAYDSRRGSYFREECLYALHILNEGLLSPDQMKGSWAGALGQLQFMPSVLYHFRVDYDGDGRIDLWNKSGDVFASAAHYLIESGWDPDRTWGREVTLSSYFDREMTGLGFRKRLNEWQALGVRPKDVDRSSDQGAEGSIIVPDGSSDKAFIVYDNFQVLLKWNRSYNFAIAVGILSDRIYESVPSISNRKL